MIVAWNTGLMDGWIEAVVPNEVWSMISPSEHEGGGILCILCMAKRLAKLGLMDVKFYAIGVLQSEPYNGFNINEVSAYLEGRMNDDG